MTDKTTLKIRELNDQFRKQGHYHLTQGVFGLGAAERLEVATRVSQFDSFTTDNDPACADVTTRVLTVMLASEY